MERRIISTPIKSTVGDDGVPAIFHPRPFDLYLTNRNQSMVILQKDTQPSAHLQICPCHLHLTGPTNVSPKQMNSLNKLISLQNYVVT